MLYKIQNQTEDLHWLIYIYKYIYDALASQKPGFSEKSGERIKVKGMRQLRMSEPVISLLLVYHPLCLFFHEWCGCGFLPLFLSQLNLLFSHNEATMHASYLAQTFCSYTCCDFSPSPKCSSVLENALCKKHCLFLGNCWAFSSFWHLLFIDPCLQHLAVH